MSEGVSNMSETGAGDAQQNAPTAPPQANGTPALEVRSGLPLGVLDDASWPERAMALPRAWGLLLSTDGLIEGRAGPDARGRLGMEGLIGLLAAPEADSRWASDPGGFVAGLIDEVMRRNGGVPLDDVAALLLTGRGAAG